MVISVAPNLTEVHDCDSVTGWSDTIAEFSLETNVYVEGSGSLRAWINATLSAVEYYAISTVDMSGGTHIYIWMLCTGVVDTKANGGYRIVLYTDSSNYATFYVGGNDTHGTGWLLMCCDVSATPDAETGTFDPADVTRIGVQFNVLTPAVKQGQVFVYNVFWDIVRYGTGLEITSGVSDAIEPDDIYVIDNDSTYKYGVVRRSYGAYIFTGELTFGDTGTASIDFEATNEVILFEENDLVSDIFNSILVLANATGTTNFELAGCFIGGNGVTIFIFEAINTNIDIMTIIGCTFKLCNSILLPVDAVNRLVDGCVFTECGQVIVSTCEVINSKWDDCEPPLISSESHRLSNAIIQNQDYGIEFDTAGTYSLSNVIFNNIATAHIHNTSGGLVTINASGTTNCTTYTGNTTINNTKELDFTGLVAGSELRAYTGIDPDTSVEIGGVESSGTNYLLSHESGGVAGYVNILHLGYIAQTIFLTYPSIDTAIPVVQIIDRNYENP